MDGWLNQYESPETVAYAVLRLAVVADVIVLIFGC